MARGVNKVTLIGNLGRDPEIRYSPTDTGFGNLSVATAERRKDKNGEWQDHTEWHRVVVLGKLADVARDYLKKGSKVYIEGRLQTRKYTDKIGMEIYQTEVVATELLMLNGKDEASHATSSLPTKSRQYSSYKEHGPDNSIGKLNEDDIPF
jgi:single-strand DNA-binding protein